MKRNVFIAASWSAVTFKLNLKFKSSEIRESRKNVPRE
jgi:hypothetical protein